MKLSAVPGPAVLMLCIMSFLFGRFTQQGAQLPEPTQIQLPTQVDSMSHRKLGAATDQLQAAQQAVLQVAATQSHAVANIDPLDPAQLENWALQSSGLLKVRPPIPAAATGDNFYRMIPFQILSWYPRIVVFPGFLDKERCQHVIKVAEKLMYPSGLAYRPGEAGDANQQTRTSTGTFVSAEQDPDGVLGWIEERIAAATLLPAQNGEAFNVLHYENLQHYDSHYDTFDPKDFGPQPSQRIATVLLYLSEVPEGGETVFKKEGIEGRSAVGDKANIEDWRNCDDGSFKYAPRQGDAVLFWGVQPNGDIDPHALHGGCPVKRGEKWVATKWIRSKSVRGMF